MRTRAVYTFTDSDDTFHIYIHCDGYPEGAAQYFANLRKFYNGKIKNFVAMEIGASFVYVNKTRYGNVYLTKHYNNHGDLEYRYELKTDENGCILTAYTMPDNMPFFSGNLDLFLQQYGSK